MDFSRTETYSFGAIGANLTPNSITNLGRSTFNEGSLTDNATQVVDFDENDERQITLTGGLTTLITSHRDEGKVM